MILWKWATQKSKASKARENSLEVVQEEKTKQNNKYTLVWGHKRAWEQSLCHRLGSKDRGNRKPLNLPTTKLGQEDKKRKKGGREGKGRKRERRQGSKVVRGGGGGRGEGRREGKKENMPEGISSLYIYFHPSIQPTNK